MQKNQMDNQFDEQFCNVILNINQFEQNKGSIDYDHGNLFLGGAYCLKPETLGRNKIGAVVTLLVEDMVFKNKIPQKLREAHIDHHKVYHVSDDLNENIIQYFNPSYNFIQQHLKATNVLVHCQGGVSRGATIVIAFVMKLLNKDFKAAYAFVKKQRKQVNPNAGFIQSLEDYQNKLKKGIEQQTKPPKINRPVKVKKHYDHIIAISGQKEKLKGNLFLGGVWSFQDNLYEDNIVSVLSILDKDVMQRYNIKDKIEIFGIKNHKWLDKEDLQDEDLLSHFDEGCEFAMESLKHGNLLIHCRAGVSRSASFVIAYLMKHHRMGIKEALEYAVQRRARVSPNEGFQEQLRQYEKRIISSLGKL